MYGGGKNHRNHCKKKKGVNKERKHITVQIKIISGFKTNNINI